MRRMSEKQLKRIDGGCGCFGYQMPRVPDDGYIVPTEQNGLTTTSWMFVASKHGFKK
jgi:hypothetical protein